jgi:hypothetical protein
MARYRAEKGMEDRDGEMTGAITMNMIFCGVAVVGWSIVVGPLVTDLRTTVGVAVAMSLTLPVLLLRLSQRVWAWMSERADRFDF